MKKQALGELAPVVVALIGVVVLLFPTILNWFSTLDYTQQAGAYSRELSASSDGTIESILLAADQYNRNLPNGPLRDPYMLSEDGKVVDLRDGRADYEAQLSLKSGEAIGWVNIPSRRIALPIFHGTDATVLHKGAGHLYGSALPVGGASTHAVITAHSGQTHAKLFDDLNGVKLDDVFTITVLNKVLYYQVDQIEVVDPVYTGEALRQVSGEDYVTLLTCTPTGVNSHRLLVRGTRIPAPPGNSGGEVAAVDYRPDFPWWVFPLIGVPSAVWAALRAADKKSRARSAGPARHALVMTPQQRLRKELS